MKFSTTLVTIAAIATVLAAPAASPVAAAEAEAEPLFLIPFLLNLIGNVGTGLANTLGGGFYGPGPYGP